MSKICAIKTIQWDAFNPLHECCRDVVYGKFGRLMARGDGGVVWQSQPCGQCGKSWNVIRGGPQPTDKPQYIFLKEYETKTEVPVGWTIIE